MTAYPRLARFKDPEALLAYLEELEVSLPFDRELCPGPGNPLGQPIRLPNGRLVGNRFCTSPMEGWDGTLDGKPTTHTYRRWQNFGRSGAKLIWGGEAVAVCHDGRANPNQLMIDPATIPELANLRSTLVQAHENTFGSMGDLVVGIQLTHSGRFSRPNDKFRLEPKLVYHHPLIDELFHIPADFPLLANHEIQQIIASFVQAGIHAQEAGFDFVDIKHCHGYLGHEFLSAYTRPGSYGGSFENRTRFLHEVVTGIQQECPGLMIGVRLSAFDFPPFQSSQGISPGKEAGRRSDIGHIHPFGTSLEDPTKINYEEIFRFLDLLRSLGVWLVNITAGSPYYNPHITRPAAFPPSDGYPPPEDPLVGVVRHINTTATIKERYQDLIIIGSAYSYLQEWLPHVAQAVIRLKLADFIGLGRMILSYPELPADILAGRPLDRKRICRTFSDCTTAPRKGLISGCYPLDSYYKNLPEAGLLSSYKKEDR